MIRIGKEKNKERKKGQMGNEGKRWKEKEEEEGKKRKDDEDKIFLEIIGELWRYGIVN